MRAHGRPVALCPDSKYTPSVPPGYADCLLLSSGPGNTTADPLFVDAPGGDLHLTAASPAVDTGAEVEGLLEDFDGLARPQGAATDIGALEYQP